LEGGLRGFSWNVDQVKELRARFWASKIYFTECLGREVTSLQDEKRRTEEMCMVTGLSVRYETLGPISPPLWHDDHRLQVKPLCCGNIKQLQTR
jgi:hypothetical protein